MKQYLQPSQCINSDHESVREYALQTTLGIQDQIEKAQAIYYKVRDSVLYDPYNFDLELEHFKASHVLEKKRSFCIPKAVLLAALARAVGIPARLGFADVKNHLSSPKLLELLRTDVFAFHGYTELFLADKWVKATPAFNRHLCKMFGVKPLEFDGINDSVFHEFSNDGRKHMQYLRDHGQFTDVPFDLLEATMKKHYPHWFGAKTNLPKKGADYEDEFTQNVKVGA